jgi:streptogramin lyase
MDSSIQSPLGITAGTDGALWFTNSVSGGGSIGRITTGGVVTNYTGPFIDQPSGIAAGPDGALWFGSDRTIGRITTSGVVTEYNDEEHVDPNWVVAGPDGAMWVTSLNNSIGRITVPTTVSIEGENLSNATQVDFNGIPASIISNSATSVVTEIPDGATTGKISIDTPAGDVTSHATFIVN